MVLKHFVISLKTHTLTTKHSTYKSTRPAFILTWHCYKLNIRSSLTFIFLLLFNFFIHCQDQHESEEVNLQVTKYILRKTLRKQNYKTSLKNSNTAITNSELKKKKKTKHQKIENSTSRCKSKVRKSSSNFMPLILIHWHLILKALHSTIRIEHYLPYFTVWTQNNRLSNAKYFSSSKMDKI